MQALRVAGLRKDYGGTTAVSGVDVSFETGEVHAVVGENGAGKSTLLRMAAGIVRPDAGAVYIEDRRLDPHTPGEAIRRGVGMVQQHFALIPVFTVLENMVLGAEPVASLGRLDLARARARAKKLLEELGSTLSLDAPVESLGVGDRQRIEIARILYRKARILVLDEPTAVLTPSEADALYASLRRLAAGGAAVIVVTHKIDEVVAYADTVTVMRRGTWIETRPVVREPSERAAEVSRLARAIMGSDPSPWDPRSQRALGGPALVLKGVSLGRVLRDVGLEVRSAEIVGIAGVEGSGQRELLQVITGAVRPDQGTVWSKTKVAVVHEDRHREGLVLDADVRENLLLGELRRFSILGWLRQRALDLEARARSSRTRIEPSRIDVPARALSGGNQQKIVTSRALVRLTQGSSVLVLAHPTRGVDIASARSIHEQIVDVATRRRAAVLIISSDLQELRALAGRILVMARGRITADLPPGATDAELGERMLAAPVEMSA
ncbi:ABC transporter ATP-binding protein [Pendulispora albinea]|uniref:ATP-binding cassette domain-containing protein n=1 Tax=Pendulispora albinea TaxID=2741071 RepID=A0ABZ2M980_9BACT